MPDEFPTFNEMQTALNLVHKHETELGTHDRMLLNIYRQISISDQKSILSHLMERAQIYNATIVATGYASFFVAWRFLQSEYGTELPLYDLSLILMLFSVLVFVIWNVYSSIQLGRDLNRKIETIARNHHDPLY